MKRIVALAAPVLAAALVNPASAQSEADRKLMYELLQKLSQFEQELREIRGQQEVLGHRLEQAGERDRSRYLDIDRRLKQLEQSVASGSLGAAPPVVPGTSQMAPGAPVGAVSAGGVAAGQSEEAAYEQVFGLLQSGDILGARQGFLQFLQTYPNGSLAPNAYYWLGETYYVNRDFDEARATFSSMLQHYPGSQKSPDAKLKLGFTLAELGETDQARSVLSEVARDYPDQAVGRLAEQRLRELR